MIPPVHIAAMREKLERTRELRLSLPIAQDLLDMAEATCDREMKKITKPRPCVRTIVRIVVAASLR